MRGRGIGSYRLGDKYVSPDRKLSELLMQESARKGPAYHWSDTLGRIAQGLTGGYLAGRDRKNQNAANEAFTKVEADSFTRQPMISEEQARGSNQVGAILDQYNDQNLMEGPMVQENVRRIGKQQDRITQAEDRIKEANNPGTVYNNPADRDKRIELENNSIANANDMIDQYGDRFNDQMAIGKGDRDIFVDKEIARQREASEQNVLDKKMPQLDYSMQNLRGLENNPYAQRLLQGLMMNQMNTDAASRLAQTQRGYKEADYKKGRTDKDADYKRKLADDIAERIAKQEFEKEQDKIKLNDEESSPFPFEGKTIPGQAMNMLLTRNPDTSSPIYHAAYAKTAKPQIFTDSTGMQTIHTPDMSMYPKPTTLNPASNWNPYNKQEDQLTGKGKWEPSPIPEGVTVNYSDKQEGESPNERSIGMPTISYRAGQGRTKFNDAENKASGFYSRMLSANKAMGGVLDGEDKIQGTPDDVKYDDVNSFSQSFKGAVPFFGNQWISNERQQLQQAQENWVSAVLRRESGAVLGDDEIVRENKKYFPQYGDSEETIAQKVLARKEAEAGMLQSSGGAWEAAQEKKSKNKRSTDKKRSTDIPEGFTATQWGHLSKQEQNEYFEDSE